MSQVSHERLSRTMSFALRHHPEQFEISISSEGWVEIRQLAKALSTHTETVISTTAIVEIAELDSKGRFVIESGRIRAAQGHSIPVELGLSPSVPPEVLFHGTVSKFLPSITRQGLVRGKREFVHMSPTLEEAISVGSRRGEAVILTVAASEAHLSGVEFFEAENGVWLATAVAPEFLSVR